MDGETIVYSSAEVAKMLGLAPAYIRTLLRRQAHLEPRKVGNMRIWTQQDVNRIKEWHSQHKRVNQKG